MRPAWWGTIAGLVVGAALGALLLVVNGRTDADERRAAEEAPDTAAVADTVPPVLPVAPAAAADDELAAGRRNAIVRATERVAPAVVSIHVTHQQRVRNPHMELLERLGLLPRREYVREVQNLGSGVIASADGLVVTNEHVVRNASQIIVTLSDGRRFPATLVDAVARYDLAVLRIDGDDLPVAPMADSDDLRIGEWAIAIGSPFGYLLADTQPTVTVGVISALNRDIAKDPQSDVAYLGMIQTDAAINPGNSGGPLVNTAGEIVGINTFIFSESGGSIGIGFAVPGSRVANVLDEIRRYGRYRDIDIGIKVRMLTSRQVRMYNLPTDDMAGVLVEAVRPDGPAYAAGLRPLDILRELEGRRVTDVGVIERVIYEANVGDRLTFRAERDGEVWDGVLDLAERR